MSDFEPSIPPMPDWDVVILGAGPSGCSCALGLLRAGRRVLLLDAGRVRPMLGESLSPYGVQRLYDLGFGHLVDSAYYQSFGIESIWDGYEGDRSHILDPYGQGAYLDSRDFCLKMLAAVRSSNGAVKESSIVKGLVGPPWIIEFTDQCRNTIATTEWVVDATGRLGFTYRTLERGQRRIDNLIAFVRLATPNDRRQMTTVEGISQGWWFTSPTSTGPLVAGFLTDSDLVTGSPRVVWENGLKRAPNTATRIATAYSDVKVFTAATIRPPDVFPRNYLPVGDAAMSFDPLCGSGIMMSIETGVEAAHAIVEDGSDNYRMSLHRSFGRYLTERKQAYTLETRHRHRPFWQRRRDVPHLS